MYIQNTLCVVFFIYIKNYSLLFQGVVGDKGSIGDKGFPGPDNGKCISFLIPFPMHLCLIV